jgi:hypothetical protein
MFCWLGWSLLLPAPLAWAESNDATPPAAPRISRELAHQIIATLPAYNAIKPPAPGSSPPSTFETPADVVRLPEVRVVEKPLPAGPDAWLTPKALQEKAIKEYRSSMTDLEWALNCFHIPFVTPPVAVRANEAYRSKKFTEEISRLSKIVDAVAKTDPQEAAKLRQAMRPYP